MIVIQGLGGRELILRGYGRQDSLYTAAVVTVDLHEGVPSTTFLLEGISSIYGTQDGAWTEVGESGVWTEPPLAGAYTQDNSYIKEYKEASFFTKEGVPS